MVPAIAGEGRALHEAVFGQGIAGILARRRTSPYLPGVRSRLWRAIPASPPGEADGIVEAEGTEPDAGTPTTEADTLNGTGTAPVMALFRRLPFTEDGHEP